MTFSPTAAPATYAEVLPNGLTVLFEPRPGPGFAFDLRLPAGSALDPSGLEGSASAVEEWLYKGAAGLDARALAGAFDDLGLRRGGGVAPEAARFSASGLRTDLGSALRLYADLLRRPELPDEELEVLLDLARQDLDSLRDSPGERLTLELRGRVFGGGYGHPVSGTEAGLDAITPESARAFWGRYGARGASLAVVADAGWPEVLDLARGTFGDWGEGAAAPAAPSFTPDVRAHLMESSQQTHIGLVAAGVDPRDPDWLLWHLALGVLAGGSASRLFVAVREERGLAYSVSAGPQLMGERAFLGAYAASTPERAQETLDVLLAELDRLKGGASGAEFLRAREGLLAATVFGAESARARASALTRDLALFGRVRSPQEVRAQLLACTPEDLNAFLARFPLDGLGVVTLGPEALHV